MSHQNIRPVVLAGGSGTRLWPVSRSLYPKQFAALTGDRSLFEQTIARIAKLGLKDPIVVGNEEHRFIVAEQLRQSEIERPVIVLEPEGRNTAAAVALAAQLAIAKDPDAILFVVPSDHWIGDLDEFQRGFEVAVQAGEGGRIVAFGIQPREAHTGYGYIRLGMPLANSAGAHAIESFHEKPDAATAARLLAEGGWLWNSGMFLFRAADMLEEIAKFESDLAKDSALAIHKAKYDGDFLRPESAAFLRLAALPIDVAVMEKTSRGAVVPVQLDWTDLGDWGSMRGVLPADANGNVLDGDVMAISTHNSLVRSDGPLVAALGVADLVIVATDDAVLVTTSKDAQSVRGIAEELRRRGRMEAELHRTVHRPWGSYRSLALNDRFQVKEIVVRPGAQLSLQLHHHRSEHWVVVNGAALVTIGDEVKMVHEAESVYVTVGTPHRLANPGKIPLRLIEVQTGSYLGEDDIVRLEDSFGRT